MNEEELRINNVVRFNNQIHYITIQDLINISESKNSENKKNIELYKPEPLTEDWLLNVGFIKIKNIKGDIKCYSKKVEPLHNDGEYIHEVIIDTEFHILTLLRFDREQCVCINVDVKYVHLLQNVWFSNIGEELININRINN